jgi:hypothetical protein
VIIGQPNKLREECGSEHRILHQQVISYSYVVEDVSAKHTEEITDQGEPRLHRWLSGHD